MLANLLEEAENQIRIQEKSYPDLVVHTENYTFVADIKNSSAIAPLLLAQMALMNYQYFGGKDAIRLIVVPYMGEKGRDFLKNAGISWMDLSGNAHIKAKNLLIRIEGKPNRFIEYGRPSSPFAPKSSRIARLLLIKKDSEFTQAEIARATKLDEGFTSKIVRRLEKENFVIKQDNGLIRVKNPDQLLDSWHEVYDFEKHKIIKGNIAARSGEELLRKIAEVLKRNKIDFAATGLGAAWLLTHFAAFRIVTFYFTYLPEENILGEMSFKEGARGSNVWFVMPIDKGVFRGANEYEGIQCVHPVQIYLDLKGHPERAKEAASILRQEYLQWRQND